MCVGFEDAVLLYSLRVESGTESNWGKIGKKWGVSAVPEAYAECAKAPRGVALRQK